MRISDWSSDVCSSDLNVANSPEVAAHRCDAVNEAVEMAQYFNDMGTQVQQFRTQADAEIGAAVDIINSELEVIAELNAQIANNLVQGPPVGDLPERRGVALKTIAEYMDLTEFTDTTRQSRLFKESGRSTGPRPSVRAL